MKLGCYNSCLGLWGTVTTVTLRKRTHQSTIAMMQSLRGSLRVHAVALAILICLTLAFVALTSKDAVPRIIFGLFCLGVSGVAIAEYRKETILSEGHLVGNGTIPEIRTGARGRGSIKYQFVSLRWKAISRGVRLGYKAGDRRE